MPEARLQQAAPAAPRTRERARGTQAARRTSRRSWASARPRRTPSWTRSREAAEAEILAPGGLVGRYAPLVAAFCHSRRARAPPCPLDSLGHGYGQTPWLAVWLELRREPRMRPSYGGESSASKGAL